MSDSSLPVFRLTESTHHLSAKWKVLLLPSGAKCFLPRLFHCLGYSDYDYDVRSVTDDTDDYADCPDVIDELEQIKPELIARVQYERKVSRSKIFDLERELEGQQDYIRANEIAKDRQIRAYQREIEGRYISVSSKIVAIFKILSAAMYLWLTYTGEAFLEAGDKFAYYS